MSDYYLTTRGMNMMTVVETTLGDLICAISEAAQEALVDEKEITAVTKLILTRLLRNNGES